MNIQLLLMMLLIAAAYIDADLKLMLRSSAHKPTI
jgi:hypothetical protein